MGIWIKRGGWLVALGVLVILGGAWLAAQSRLTAARLAADGLDLPATIDSMYEQTTVNDGIGRRSSDTEHTDYFATVTFAAPDGSTQTVTQTVSKSWYDTWFPNQTVTIRALPDDLSVVEIDPGHATRSQWIGATIMAGFGVLTVATGLVLVRTFNAKARLAVEGQSVTARVEQVRRQGQFAVLRYRFTLPDGQSFAGSSLPKPPARFAGVAQGAAVEVIYDPRAPRHNRPAFDLSRPG